MKTVAVEPNEERAVNFHEGIFSILTRPYKLRPDYRD